MKKMKAILSVFLCLLMLLACFAPATAVGAESGRMTVAAKAPRLYSAYQKPDSIDDELPLDTFFERVEKALFTEATEVDVSDLEIPYDGTNGEIWSYINNYVATTPRFLRIGNWSVSLQAITADEIIIKTVKYNGDSAANLAKREACEAAMVKLMYGVKDNESLSDYDKLLLLHDRLDAWVAYDMSDSISNDSDSYSAYGALVNRVAVCQGYSMAYGWMLDQLGIENYYVTSDSIHHGWCKVKLGDDWYYADVTSDDPVYDVPGRVLHKNFLIPYTTQMENHTPMGDVTASDYDSSISSDAYAASFDKKSRTEIVWIDGAYYYFDNTVTPAQLVKREKVGSTYNYTPILTVNTATFANTTHESASPKGTNWIYTPKMTAIGSKIIYTDGKKVFVCDVSAETPVAAEIFTLENDNAIFAEFAPADGDSEETAAAKAATLNEFILQGLQQTNGKVYVTAFNDESFEPDTVTKYTVEVASLACDHANEALLSGEESPSCTEGGYKEYICKDCRYVWDVTTAPQAHVFEVVERKDATCTEAGYINYKCKNCTATKTETLAALNHPDTVEVGAIPGNCQEPGYTAGTFCNTCGTYFSGHVATTIDPNNHINTYVTKKEKVATCENAGWTAELTCRDCGNIASASVPVAAKGHDDVATVVPATCTKNGYTKYKCSRCWREYTVDNPDDPALNHPDTVEVDEVKATCVSTGYTAGVYCNTCKTYIEGHVLLLKDRNNHAGWQEVNTVADCEHAGVQGAIVCTGCGAYKKDADGKEIRGIVTPALGHEWAEDVVVIKEATCTDTGIEKRTCTVCHKVEAVSTDKLGHIDLNKDEICDRCEKNLKKDACPYCNQVHSGVFGFLVKFIHKALYLFFGPKKAK